MRKRGRVKLCTNTIVSVSMRKRRRTHTRVKLNVRAGSRSRRGRVDQIWPDQRKCASAGPALAQLGAKMMNVTAIIISYNDNINFVIIHRYNDIYSL